MITPEQRAMWLLSGANSTAYDTDKCIHCCVSIVDGPPNLSWHCPPCWKVCTDVNCAIRSGLTALGDKTSPD